MTVDPEPITDTTAQEIMRIDWDVKVTQQTLRDMMIARGFCPDPDNASQLGTFLKCHSLEQTKSGRARCRIHFDSTTRYLTIYTRLRKDGQHEG